MWLDYTKNADRLDAVDEYAVSKMPDLGRLQREESPRRYWRGVGDVVDGAANASDIEIAPPPLIFDDTVNLSPNRVR
jgi:hypothetical protein